MRYALSFSGGKDSTLALDRALHQGLDVAYLFNIFEGLSGRVRFHGIRAPLIAAQAQSIGIPLIQDSTHPDDYEVVFLRILNRLHQEGIEAINFGNIHLADIRAWYEERVTARGFRHVEPLWKVPGVDLVQNFIDRGYVARVVSIDLARTPEAWLGRTVDQSLLAEIAGHPPPRDPPWTLLDILLILIVLALSLMTTAAIGVAVDVCHATDTPGNDKKNLGDTRLGHGPGLFRGARTTRQCAKAGACRRSQEIEAGCAVMAPTCRHGYSRIVVAVHCSGDIIGREQRPNGPARCRGEAPGCGTSGRAATT